MAGCSSTNSVKSISFKVFMFSIMYNIVVSIWKRRKNTKNRKRKEGRIKRGTAPYRKREKYESVQA